MNETINFQFPALKPLEYQTIILGLWHAASNLLGEIASDRGEVQAVELKARLIQRLKNIDIAGAPLDQEPRAIGLFLGMLRKLPTFPGRIDDSGAQPTDRDR